MWNIVFLPIWYSSISPSNTSGRKILPFCRSYLILAIKLEMRKTPFKRNPYLREKFGLSDFSLKSRLYCTFHSLEACLLIGAWHFQCLEVRLLFGTREYIHTAAVFGSPFNFGLLWCVADQRCWQRRDDVHQASAPWRYDDAGVLRGRGDPQAEVQLPQERGPGDGPGNGKARALKEPTHQGTQTDPQRRPVKVKITFNEWTQLTNK